MIICRHCGNEFSQPNKNGFRDECPRCVAEKSLYVDPLEGENDEARQDLYRYCERKGLDGEAREQYLWELMRDLKDLAAWARLQP